MPYARASAPAATTSTAGSHAPRTAGPAAHSSLANRWDTGGLRGLPRRTAGVAGTGAEGIEARTASRTCARTVPAAVPRTASDTVAAQPPQPSTCFSRDHASGSGSTPSA